MKPPCINDLVKSVWFSFLSVSIIMFSRGKSFLLPTRGAAALPLEHITAPDLLCKSLYNGTNRITREALKNARAVHYICACRTKKPAVSEASLKQGTASLCCWNEPSLCASFLISKLLFLPFLLHYLAFPSGFQLPCLLLWYSRPGKKTKTKPNRFMLM